MIKALIVFLTMLFVIVTLSADLNQLRIVGQAEKTSDIVPARYETVNRERAACIIFVTDLAVDLDFRPRIELVGFTQPAVGQYNVYVAPGERVIDVHASGFSPLIVVFRDFGIPTLRSGDVYRLRLTGDITNFRSMERININVQVTPPDAMVFLNGEEVYDKRRISSPVGTSLIRVEKEGFSTHIEEIEVNENNTFFEFELDLKMDVPVVINSSPGGAKVLIDDVEKGVTPAQFFHPEGKFRIVLEPHDTYIRVDEEIEIKHPQTIMNYNLTEEIGTIAISVFPVDASVTLNGNERTLTSNGSYVFRNIAPGSYELEIKASGYKTLSEAIQLKKNETVNKQYILDTSPDGDRFDFSHLSSIETNATERGRTARWWEQKWIGLGGTALAIASGMVAGTNNRGSGGYACSFTSIDPSSINRAMGETVGVVNVWHNNPLTFYANPAIPSFHKGFSYGYKRDPWFDEIFDDIYFNSSMMSIGFEGLTLTLPSFNSSSAWGTTFDYGDFGTDFGNPKDHASLIGLSIKPYESLSKITDSVYASEDFDFAIGISRVGIVCDTWSGVAPIKASIYNIGMITSINHTLENGYDSQFLIGYSAFNVLNEEITYPGSSYPDPIFGSNYYGFAYSLSSPGKSEIVPDYISHDNLWSFRLLSSIEGGDKFRYNIYGNGLEYGLIDTLYLRVGRHDNRGGDIRGFSYGLGVNLKIKESVTFSWNYAGFPGGGLQRLQTSMDFGLNVDIMAMINN